MIRAFYDGNQYLLFVNRKFQDVRLVGAPPSSIGKFGSDTDNWVCHDTREISLFRVYADKTIVQLNIQKTMFRTNQNTFSSFC